MRPELLGIMVSLGQWALPEPRRARCPFVPQRCGLPGPPAASGPPHVARAAACGLLRAGEALRAGLGEGRDTGPAARSDPGSVRSLRPEAWGLPHAKKFLVPQAGRGTIPPSVSGRSPVGRRVNMEAGPRRSLAVLAAVARVAEDAYLRYPQ